MRAYCLLPTVYCLLFPAPVKAQGTSVGDFDFTVTETFYSDWHQDFNFNARDASGKELKGSYDYLDLKNRFNLGARSDLLSAGLRLDTAHFFGPDGGIEGTDFASRFHDDVTVEKLFAVAKRKDVSVEIGDFYACLGKGIALCVQKMDELSFDTTLRGGKAVLDSKYAGFTALGGYSNIVNVGDRIEGLLPDPLDLVLGAEGRLSPFRWLRVSTHASRIIENEDDGFRAMEAAGAADRRSEITMLGGMLSVPELGGASLLVEYDYMVSDHVSYGWNDTTFAPDFTPREESGSALYGMVSWNVWLVHLLAEGKWYEGFDELGALGRNIDNSSIVDNPNAVTKDAVYYAVLPTLEDESMFYFDKTFFDVYGGRVRLDFEIPPTTSVVYGSVSMFDWVHDPDPILEEDHFVRHAIGGIEQRVDSISLVANASAGRRHSRRGPTLSTENIDHAEGDIQFPLSGPHAIGLAGRTEMHDLEDATEPDYLIAKSSLTYSWAPALSVSGILEYSDQPSHFAGYESGSDKYFGAIELTLRFLSGSYAKVFAGSTRGGLQCSGGQCRTFPPFEGVKGELTLRF